MNSSRDRIVASGSPLAKFLERIRVSFSHDLRTPLGTIVNYAAVLEATSAEGLEDVRDLGQRIRANAQRAARMIQLLANATGLAARPLHATSTDLFVLARSVLTDAGGRGQVTGARDTLGAPAEVDAEVVGFAWRAYVSVEQDTRGKPVDDAVLQVVAEPDQLVVELRCGPDRRVDAPVAASMDEVELTAYLRHDGGPDRLESAMGLRLAQDLIVCLGGDLRVWGRPGARSGMRLLFPLMAPDSAPEHL